MALQGKITASRSFQSNGGVTTKAIVARNITLGAGLTLAALGDVDTSARVDGAIILWDDATSTFKVRPDAENANLKIIGGSF
jgi:hypothetical protein|tara:strand:- start:13 stop:258 length:246 start_codon:yes stop_codon:yes gene_type:complete